MKPFNKTSLAVSLGKGQRKNSQKLKSLHYKIADQGDTYEQCLDYFDKPSFEIDFLPSKVRIDYFFQASCHDRSLLTFQDKLGNLKVLAQLTESRYHDWFFGDFNVYAEGSTLKKLGLLQFSPDQYFFRLYLLEPEDENMSPNDLIKSLISHGITAERSEGYLTSSYALKSALNPLKQ